MTPPLALIEPLVSPFLERQAWFESATAGEPEAALVIRDFDVLAPGPPGFGRLIISRGEQHFQLHVGWRHPHDLHGSLRRRESALLGSIGTGEDQLVIYDALADDTMCLQLLELATSGNQAVSRVRSVSSLTSHAALVFDDRLFMKCYRVLEPGERTEVVTSMRLDDVGFNALPGPVGRLRAHDFDLVFVREFMPSALEGRMLALTSLRDLLAYADGDDVLPPGVRNRVGRVDRQDPERAAAAAGGDLASETFRLGQTVAYLHTSLREAFGELPPNPTPLIDSLTVEIERDNAAGRTYPNGSPIERARETIIEHQHGDLGHAIRLHGELHLRRVMRGETGWVVTGFSDDPLFRPQGHASSLAPRTGNPLGDIADMYMSIELIANEALSQRPSAHSPVAVSLAAAWVARNQASFFRGYVSTLGANALLPTERHLTDAMLTGYLHIRRSRYEATFAEASP